MKEKVDIEKVYSRKKNGVVPMLMKFQNGKLSAFTKENTEFTRLRSSEDKNKVVELLMANGSSYSGVINNTESSELTDTYVCVQNKKTNTLESIAMTQVKTVLMMKDILKQKEKNLTFPIMQMNTLYEVENEIGGKKEEYIAVLGPIITNPLSRSLTNIIDTKVLLQFNYEGLKTKKAFRDLVNLNDVIFHCLSKEGYNKENYKKDLQTALRWIKNRHFKDVSVKKKTVQKSTIS